MEGRGPISATPARACFAHLALASTGPLRGDSRRSLAQDARACLVMAGQEQGVEGIVWATESPGTRAEGNGGRFS